MLERTDTLDPARAPFGKPTTRLTTPNIFDLVVVEDVPISPETYRPLPYKSPHPDYANNHLILVWQGSVKAANNQINVRRVYASESEAPENWYNYSIKYAGDVVGNPIYVRSYIVLREDYAPKARGTTLGAVMLLRMTNRGSGYTTAPTVAITGGGGSGATAVAILADDKVIGLQILTEGTGYTSNPTVGFSGGGGTGAAASAMIQPVGAVLIKEETTKLDSEDQQLASLFIRVHQIYEVLPGPIFSSDLWDERGEYQRTTQSVLATGTEVATFDREPVGDRSLATKTWFEPRGDSAIVLTKFVETWIEIQVDDQAATSEFGGGILDVTERTDEPGAQTPDTGFLVVSSRLKTKSPREQIKVTEKLSPDSAEPVLELTQGGSGYTSPPTVGFSGGTGSAAAATAVLGKPINTITVTSGGSGYVTPPTIGFIDGGGGGAFAIAVLGFAIDSIVMSDGGSGYTSPPTVVVGGDGTGGAGTAVLGKGVASVAVTAPGSGWTGVPVAVFTGDGTGTAANVVMGHPVLSIPVDAPGSGYTSAPTVSFTGGEGSGATATAVLQYTVASATVTNGGTGYATAPVVGFSGGGGAGAAATASLVEDFGIDDFGNVTAAGSGYTSPPTIGFSGGGGSGAAATALIGKPVASIAVTNGGSGYATPPAVTINAPGDPWGSGATAHAVLTAGVVTSIVVDTPGADYTVALTVSFSGGGGTGAAASVTMGPGRLLDIVRTATGHGYTSAPTLSFSGGGGTGAAGTITTASLGLVVDTITITAPGSGYTSAPTIALTGGGGTGAAATAVLSATASIKSVTLTAPGTGFTTAPAIGFSGGAGTGATAHAVLDLETLQVSHIDVVAPGTGYTTAPTLSFSGGGGTGLTATASLASSGSVKSVTLTTPGTGYTTAPAISFTGGAGIGASASSILALTGSVKSVTVSNGGLFETTPTIQFDGNGSGAAATAALASAGQVKRLNLTTPGLYTVAPTVGFSGGGGTGAAAIYHIGDQLWPTLLGHHTDPTEGIVINLLKTVIPANTPHPGRGNYVDDETYDRWKTIRIVSAVDLSTLPLPETYWTTHRYDFPPQLLAIEALWSDVVSKAVSAQETRAAVSVSSGANAGIAVRKSSGFNGWAKAMVTRTFFFGPPPQSAIPLPYKIITASGSVVLTATNSRTNYAEGDDGGVAFGDSFQKQIHDADIQGVLVGNYQIINPTHYSPPQSALAKSGGGSIASVLAAGTLCKMDVRLNPSTPALLIPGQMILAEAIPEKWRFGVWTLRVIYVVVP